MERLTKDLHTALKNKLPFHARYSIFLSTNCRTYDIDLFRIRIALDVVEGLRYLHGLGLVHRDIKLKNVLVSTSSTINNTSKGIYSVFVNTTYKSRGKNSRAWINYSDEK